MVRLAGALRAEIRRVAGRELRRESRRLAGLDKRIESLTRTTRGLRRELTRFTRKMARLESRQATAVRGQNRRFPRGRAGRPLTPRSIRSMRERLRLPRREFARLLEVSAASIYGWESGRFTPRGKSLTRLGEVRKLGLRVAQRQLGLAAPKRSRRARASRRRGRA